MHSIYFVPGSRAGSSRAEPPRRARQTAEPSQARLAHAPSLAELGSARLVSSPTRGGSGPPAVCWFYARGRSGWTREVPDPYGGSEALAVGSELPLLRETWRLRTRPRAGSGSGAVGLVR